MFPYKFSSNSQKTDTIQTGATSNNQFRRPSGANPSGKSGFDGGFSRSLSPRSVESRALGTLPYLRHTPEIDAPQGISSLVKDEPTEITIKPRAFTFNPSSANYPKGLVKPEIQEVELGPVEEIEPEDYLGSVSAKFRQLKKEGAERRAYIMDLESQLAVSNEKNSVLLRDIARMKAAHKQENDKHRDAVARALRNYSSLKSELDDFKLSSESSWSIISEVKVTMGDLVALRDGTQMRLQELESIFDSDGQLILTAESRETVHELRSELSKTQQVADLLRDKLHTMGTELVQAQSRALELEDLLTLERKRVDLNTLQVRQSDEKVAKVTRCLEEQKRESIQTTMRAYEMEEQLMHAQTRLQEAQNTAASMKEEMTAREEFHEEQTVKLRTLRNTIDFQEGNVKALQARVEAAEEQLTKVLNHNHELQGRLESSMNLEKNLTQQASRLLSERDETKEKLRSTECQLLELQGSQRKLSSDIDKGLTEHNMLVDKLKSLEDVKREADMYRERYTEVQVSLKVLQDRFDDQCVTLSASKDTIGELQESIFATERRVAETSAASRHEITRLQEQNQALMARLEHADKLIEEKTTTFQTLQIESSRKEGAFQALLEVERSKENQTLAQVHEAKMKNDSLVSELALKNQHTLELAERLAAAEAPSNEHERELTALKVRIAELETTEKRLADRAITICCRYETNDLNDDEKALVALLTQKARAVHDREMVEKANEIKRRDNINKQHEARIAQLEGILKLRICDEWQVAGDITKCTDQQSNSVTIKVTKPQGPSSDHQPETRGAGHEPTTATHTTNAGAVNPSHASAPSRSTATFAKLCREDTDDIAKFEDENVPVATGKRVMFADEIERSRPARRAKHGKMTENLERLDDDLNISASTGTGAGGNKKRLQRRR